MVWLAYRRVARAMVGGIMWWAVLPDGTGLAYQRIALNQVEQSRVVLAYQRQIG